MPDNSQPFKEEDVIGVMKYNGGDDLTIVNDEDGLRVHAKDAGGWYSRGFCAEDVAELLRQLAAKDEQIAIMAENARAKDDNIRQLEDECRRLQNIIDGAVV